MDADDCGSPTFCANRYILGDLLLKINPYRSKSRSLGLEGDLRAGKCEKVPGDFLSDQKRPMGVFFNFH